MSNYYLSNREVNMAEAAAARREARRKRILENSHNRLQLISGKNDDLPRESTNKSPIPQAYEPAILADSGVSSDYSLLNGILGSPESSEVETIESLSSRHDVVAAGDGEVVNDLAAFQPSSPPEQHQTSSWKAIISYKYDIVLLSLLLQFIHGVASIPFDQTYFFLPLIIYSVTKLVWFPKQSNSSIANALLLLNGLSANRLHKMLGILQWSSTISQDVCIYLFTTICFQSLYTTLKESFVT